MQFRVRSLLVPTLALLLSPLLVTATAVAEAAPTTTALGVTSANKHVTSVASGAVVTLTARVKSGNTVVKVGQVNFCNTTGKTCTDIHLLGTAQLTKSGKAVLRFIPGIGSHNYNAIFLGTPNGTLQYAGSESKDASLSVSGAYPTATTISAVGSKGDYTLTATIAGSVNSPMVAAPAGSVSFVDTTNSNRVLGTAALGNSVAAFGFLNSDNPTTNPFPQSVAVADFNGDGKLDLVVPVYSIFTPLPAANVLLGNGDGTFTAGPVFSVTGQNINNAAVGDFNGDGKLDLALSLPDTNSIQVLLGNGDGSFTPRTPISIPLGVFFITTGDLNQDGKADLIVTNNAVDSLTILLGNGDGTFKAVTQTPRTGGFPTSVAVGDFNRDGIPDLAVANDNQSTGVPGSVTILLGKGDGTFKAKTASPATGDTPASIVVGDFNGDGKLDLAVANLYVDTGEPGSVTILLGNGNGTFTPTAVSPVAGFLAFSVAIGDFNGDGKADIVTANAASNTATVLLGNGDGTFAAPLNPEAGIDPLFAAVGDFNSDGLTDAAVADNSVSSVTIMLGQDMQTATASASGISPLGSGQHLVEASYGGDSIYVDSISATISLSGSGMNP